MGDTWGPLGTLGAMGAMGEHVGTLGAVGTMGTMGDYGGHGGGTWGPLGPWGPQRPWGSLEAMGDTWGHGVHGVRRVPTWELGRLLGTSSCPLSGLHVPVLWNISCARCVTHEGLSLMPPSRTALGGGVGQSRGGVHGGGGPWGALTALLWAQRPSPGAPPGLGMAAPCVGTSAVCGSVGTAGVALWGCGGGIWGGWGAGGDMEGTEGWGGDGMG